VNAYTILANMNIVFILLDINIAEQS